MDANDFEIIRHEGQDRDPDATGYGAGDSIGFEAIATISGTTYRSAILWLERTVIEAEGFNKVFDSVITPMLAKRIELAIRSAEDVKLSAKGKAN